MGDFNSSDAIRQSALWNAYTFSRESMLAVVRKPVRESLMLNAMGFNQLHYPSLLGAGLLPQRSIFDPRANFASPQLSLALQTPLETLFSARVSQDLYPLRKIEPEINQIALHDHLQVK